MAKLNSDLSVIYEYTLVTKRKVYFGVFEDVAVFILQPTI